MRIVDIIALGALALFGVDQASADGAIELKMVVQEEVITLNDKGEEVVILTEPTSVVPGDIIVFTTYYHNKGEVTAENVAITNPIPKDTAYKDGSAAAENASVSYSIDNGNKFDLPEKLVTIDATGEKRPATPNDYTHIRWTLKSVLPDTDGSVSFHAKVR